MKKKRKRKNFRYIRWASLANKLSLFFSSRRDFFLLRSVGKTRRRLHLLFALTFRRGVIKLLPPPPPDRGGVVYNGSLGESVQTGGGGVGEEGADKKLSVVFIWESRSCGSVVGLSGKGGGRGKARIAAIIHKGKMYDNKVFVNAYKHIFAGKRNY